MRFATFTAAILVAASSAGMISTASAADVVHDVQLAPQKHPCTCWAASAAMLIGWKEKQSIGEQTAAQRAGKKYLDRFNASRPGENCENQGLLLKDIADFAKQLKLKAEAPQNFSEAGWRNLLAAGPLWVAIGFRGAGNEWAGHVFVVSGVAGSGAQTRFVIHDPAFPAPLRLTLAELAKFLEGIPNGIKGSPFLPPQVLHF